MSTRYCDERTTRRLIGMLDAAAPAATPGVIPAELVILHRAVLDGCTDADCAQLLADFGPLVAGLPAVDRELHGAAVCLVSALRHLQRGEDPAVALTQALAHLHAALDAHTPTGGSHA